MPPKTKKVQELYALYQASDQELHEVVYESVAAALSDAGTLLQEAEDNGDDLEECEWYVVKLTPVGRIVLEKKVLQVILDTEDKKII